MFGHYAFAEAAFSDDGVVASANVVSITANLAGYLTPANNLSDLDNAATPLTPEWSTYRQALRDITGQDGFPYQVTWPIKT